MKTRAATLVLLPLTLSACSAAAPTTATTLPATPVQVGSKTYTLEIAKTGVDRQRGLMRRDSMPELHGMIFVFPDVEERGFWMKNTRIPLDIVYLSAGAKVVSIKTMKPFDENTTPSDFPAKYAIELNAGQAQACGVKVGDVIALPPEAKDTTE